MLRHDDGARRAGKWRGRLPRFRSPRGCPVSRAKHPARFVTGYTRYEEPPQDFHAVFEAYLGGHWQMFDPTELAPIDSIACIGVGRDAADVAFATFFGSARLRRLSPLVEPCDNVAQFARLQTPTSGILLAA